MIPGFDFVEFAQTAGPLAAVLVVASIVFAESGLLIGFFLPGDSILFTLGLLIQGTANFSLNLNIHLVIILLFIAAAAGDNVGYAFGKKVGPRIFTKPNSLLFRQENVIRAQEFYDKYGGKTIIMARFIPIVRTFAPLIAGVANMKYRTFVTFNLIGAVLWTAGITYLGYFIGAALVKMGIDIDTILLPAIALIIFVSILPALYHLLKDKKQRRVIWEATKIQWQKIIKRKK
jgi:membrane-associated protein